MTPLPLGVVHGAARRTFSPRRVGTSSARAFRPNPTRGSSSVGALQARPGTARQAGVVGPRPQQLSTGRVVRVREATGRAARFQASRPSRNLAGGPAEAEIRVIGNRFTMPLICQAKCVRHTGEASDAPPACYLQSCLAPFPPAPTTLTSIDETGSAGRMPRAAYHRGDHRK